MAEVTDRADADRLARKMARLMAKRSRVKAEYEAALAKELGRLDRHISYSKDRLHRFLARQLEEDPDGDPLAARTIDLPCGAELKYRPKPVGQRRLVVKDEKALYEWAWENGCTSTSVSVSNDAVRRILELGGHVEGAYLGDPDWKVYSVTIPKSLLADEAEDEEAGA